MDWGRPEAFWLLLLVPLLAGLHLRAHLARRRDARRFADREEALPAPSRGWRALLKAGLVALAATALVLALADPRYGRQPFSLRARGVDVLVLLDTSRSMLARDESPTRLGRARRAVYDLLKRMRGDRVGILPFSGDAFLACPLTIDYGAARMILADVDVGSVARGGTDLARAVDAALDAFRRTRREEGGGTEAADPEAELSGRHDAIVVLTDGGDHSGRALDAVRRARKAGAHVFILGIGGTEPVPIPLPGRGEASYVTDAAGGRVETRLEEETLRTLAEGGGGFYARLDPHNRALDRLYAEGIGRLERRSYRELESRLVIRRFQSPLLVGLLLLAAEALVSLRGWRTRRGGGLPATGGAAAVLLLALLLPSESRAGESPSYGRAVRENNAGVDLLAEEDPASAEDAFERAAALAPEDARAAPLLNLAETRLARGRAEEAREAFARALESATDDALARIHFGLGRLSEQEGDARLPEGFRDGIPPRMQDELAPEETRSAVRESLGPYREALSAYGRSLAALSESDVSGETALVAPEAVRHNHERTWRRIGALERWLEMQEQMARRQEQQQEQEQQEQEQKSDDAREQQNRDGQGGQGGQGDSQEEKESGGEERQRGGDQPHPSGPEDPDAGEEASRAPESGEADSSPPDETAEEDARDAGPPGDSGEEAEPPRPEPHPGGGERREPDTTEEEDSRRGREREDRPVPPSSGSAPGAPERAEGSTGEDGDAGTTGGDEERIELLYRRIEEQEKAERRARLERALRTDPQVEKDW